ncbi:MAG: YwiC-like family protein [Thermoanaerobaculia bacterium]
MTIWPDSAHARVRNLVTTIFPPGVSLKRIALPVEHGGWGIVFEPIVLGLIAFPSVGGVLIALAAVGAFFVRQPLKLALVDQLRGRVYPRTRAAVALAFLFGLFSALLMAGALATSGATIMLPLVLAAPLALVQVWYDAKNDSRQLLPELSGATAMSGVVAMIALAAGEGWIVAAAIWGVMICRALPTILYVRSRVLIERGAEASRWIPVLAHVAAALLGFALFRAGLMPAVVPIVLAILLARCAIGLSPFRRRASARAVGFTEIAWGAAAVIAIGLGLAL